MSETQEIVNEPEIEVSPEDAAAAAEEQAFLNEDDPDAQPEETVEPEAEKGEQPETVPKEHYENVKKGMNQARFEQRQSARQLKELQESQRQVQEMLGQLTQNARGRGDEPVIDPENDPMGAIRYLTAKVQAQEHQAQQQAQQAQAQQQETQIRGQIYQYMQEAESVAQQEFPDYTDAAKFVVQQRGAELQALGYQAQQIQDMVKDEYEGLAYQAMQAGQNPAYLVYQQAKARGFTGAAPKPEQSQQQLDAMKRGMQTPRTQRGTGGARKGGAITEEQLMSASGAEFDKLWAQFEKQNAQ
jgi:hypothetical protein